MASPALRAASPRIFVVMPAYNAARTLERTYDDLPHELIDTVIVVDDGSRDETAAIARQLGLKLFVHNRNYGYGANQKTCYREAIKAGADVIVMVHPDYQYDPTLVPEIVAPILDRRADVVLGSRLLGANPVRHGMPWWKYAANRGLTSLENLVFGLRLSEYHTGYRAYSREALEAVNFEMNADGFVFDQEILAQMVHVGLRIVEVPVPTRYFPEASSASFRQSLRYGVAILRVLGQYAANRSRLLPQRRFDSLARRYEPVSSPAAPPPRTDTRTSSSTPPPDRS
jgi:glycosyltransferase involved in cell wall biosynthesis